MITKTPRTDQLLEFINKNSLGWKTQFDLAIELAESLEFEFVKLEKQNKQLLEALTKIAKRLEAGSVDEWTVADLAGIARAAINKPTEEI